MKSGTIKAQRREPWVTIIRGQGLATCPLSGYMARKKQTNKQTNKKKNQEEKGESGNLRKGIQMTSDGR
jgi:hypothetical protein